MEVVHDFKQTIWGIAIDAEDNIFVANYSNNSIDKVSLNNGKASVTQSTKVSPSPLGLAINSKNEIYIGTYGEIKKMTKEGIISSIAGNSGKRGFVDGIGKDARIGIVEGICFDENDTPYFCDEESHAIRKLTPEGKVTTICGGELGNTDGKGKQATFDTPIGIVYNNHSKIFYITDYYNNSIRTMTVDGNVNTLCKYSDRLRAIADEEGKLYISTEKIGIGSEEGELITVDTKGEIKQMNISVKNCYGLAFNSKGDFFFTLDRKLNVIRNCTKYPPQSLTTNINMKETQVQRTNHQQTEIEELRKQLMSSQSENQKLKEQLTSTQLQLASIQAKLASIEAEQQNKKRKLSEDK